MTSVDDPRDLVEEAFRLGEAGECDAGIEMFGRALAGGTLPRWHELNCRGARAALLGRVGRHDEALRDLEYVLDAELEDGGTDGTLAVAVARYLLAEAALKSGDHKRALEAVFPSTAKGTSVEALLRMVEALALHEGGRDDEARSSARLALSCASTRQLKAIQERLADLC